MPYGLLMSEAKKIKIQETKKERQKIIEVKEKEYPLHQKQVVASGSLLPILIVAFLCAIGFHFIFEMIKKRFFSQKHFSKSIVYMLDVVIFITSVFICYKITVARQIDSVSEEIKQEIEIWKNENSFESETPD